jgi:hypothetical protein
MVCFNHRWRVLRSFGAVLLAYLLLAACGQPSKPSTIVPAGAPPPQKIERLLVWFPDDAFLDTAAVTQAFKTKFAAHGVAVEVGVSKRLELDKREAQRAIIAGFRPTNVLDFGYRGTSYSGGYGGQNVILSMIGSLTDMRGRTLRQFVFPVSGSHSKSLIGPKFVDQVLATLQAEGYV